MPFLRSLLFSVITVVTVIPMAFFCLLVAPLPRQTRFRLTVKWPGFMLHVLRVLCGVKWEVRGRENIPEGPAILLAKHQSTWETFFIVSQMRREVCFVFKRELLWLPFFGWGIGLLDMIHIDRRKGREAFETVVEQGKRKLAEGRLIIMFPEGTRIPPGKQGRYRSGGTRLAVRTGVPVVPIAHDAGEVWPKRRFIKKPGTVTVSIGPAIPSDGRDPEELMLDVEAWIETEMRRLAPHRYDGPWQPEGGNGKRLPGAARPEGAPSVADSTRA